MQQTLDLGERVRRLERTNRRFRVALVMALTVGGALILMGQAAPERAPLMIKAHAFQLVNSDGAMIGGLTTTPGGLPVLGFADTSGKVRLKMVVQPDGSSSFTLLDGKGAVRVELAQMSDGAAGITLLDGNLAPRARFALAANGAPSVTLTGEDGKPISLGGAAAPAAKKR